MSPTVSHLVPHANTGPPPSQNKRGGDTLVCPLHSRPHANRAPHRAELEPGAWGTAGPAPSLTHSPLPGALANTRCPPRLPPFSPLTGHLLQLLLPCFSLCSWPVCALQGHTPLLTPCPLTSMPSVPLPAPSSQTPSFPDLLPALLLFSPTHPTSSVLSQHPVLPPTPSHAPSPAPSQSPSCGEADHPLGLGAYLGGRTRGNSPRFTALGQATHHQDSTCCLQGGAPRWTEGVPHHHHPGSLRRVI